jgi:hypothetical protein
LLSLYPEPHHCRSSLNRRNYAPCLTRIVTNDTSTCATAGEKLVPQYSRPWTSLKCRY